jgi:hypothetical protein
MTSILLVIVMTFFLSSTVMGAPLCPSASLEAYVVLGAGGCQIGDKLFFNFTYAGGGAGGAPPIPANGISVVTINTPLNPGLTFSAPWSVGPGQALNSLIQFDVTVLPGGTPIKDISASMVGSGHVGDGVASVTENVTNGGPLASIFLQDDGGEVTNQTVEFPPTIGPIHVAKSISVKGGSSGSAVIASVTNQFSEGLVTQPSVSVPTMTEWGVIMLTVFLGIGSVYYLRRRGLAV